MIATPSLRLRPDSGRQFQKREVVDGREVVDEHSDLACHG
jgi:hypothetical protein